MTDLPLSRFFGRMNLSHFHRTVVYTVALQMGMTVLSALVSIVISRTLGVESKGVLSWMMASSTFCLVIIEFGIGAPLLKNLARRPGESSTFILLNFIILSGASLIALPAIYYFARSLPMAQHNPALFIIALFLAPFMAISTIFNNTLVSLGRNLHYNLLFSVEKSVTIFLSLFLIATGYVQPFTVIIAFFAVYILPPGDRHSLRQALHSPPALACPVAVRVWHDARVDVQFLFLQSRQFL